MKFTIKYIRKGYNKNYAKLLLTFPIL